MATIEVEVTCPYCNSNHVVKNGKDEYNKQRFLCKNELCNHKTFLLDYKDIGRQQHIKNLILKMAVNGSGVRDTARVQILEPFNIGKYYTDNWGAYSKNLDKDKHEIGKRNTQTIERKNLTLRTRVKRLTRKTICFSKSIKMHDIVIGLLINVLDFGLLL